MGKEKALELHKEALTFKKKTANDNSDQVPAFFLTELLSKEQKGQPKLKPIPESRESKVSQGSKTSRLDESIASRSGKDGITIKNADEKSRDSLGSLSTRDSFIA